jgi:hypothetical protein
MEAKSHYRRIAKFLWETWLDVLDRVDGEGNPTRETSGGAIPQEAVGGVPCLPRTQPP